MKIVEYREEFGEYTFPEGFEEGLHGLTLEEQMERYRVTEYVSYSRTNWGERTYSTGYIRLDRASDVKALIVREGILVGVMILNDCGREQACFAEEGVCTYYAEDNNGAGYKTREDYLYLVCVPSDFNK